MPVELRAGIVENKRLGASYARMVLDAPPIASIARPGQFVTVRVSDSWDPLLRRPFSIHRVDPDDPGRLEILYAIRGRGTALLAEAAPGAELSVIGPMGRGFRIDEQAAHHLLVAGGIGVAPLLFLAQELAPGREVALLLGGKTEADLLAADEMRSLGVRVELSTESGETGTKGMVTDLLEQRLSAGPTDGLAIYACGPVPMLREVSALALEAGAACQVSLEARMACGLGACYGCVAPVRSEDPAGGYERVCADGPVFDASAIRWEEMWPI